MEIMDHNPRIGSSFDEVLAADGTLEAIEERSIKRVLAWQIGRAIEAAGLSKTEVAQRMGTSRAALDRLLDPDNGSLTLSTLSRAAEALGKTLRIDLVDRDDRASP